jgi:hypothetical protein
MKPINTTALALAGNRLVPTAAAWMPSLPMTALLPSFFLGRSRRFGLLFVLVIVFRSVF